LFGVATLTQNFAGPSASLNIKSAEHLWSSHHAV
jgi:hypothetical protein